MPKVFATWVMTLRRGVTKEEFERFVREELPAKPLPGTKLRILKGERGEGLGKYLSLNEFESMELWNRYFPMSGGQVTHSSEAQELMQSETFRKFLSLIDEPHMSDWVVVLE